MSKRRASRRAFHCGVGVFVLVSLLGIPEVPFAKSPSSSQSSDVDARVERVVQKMSPEDLHHLVQSHVIFFRCSMLPRIASVWSPVAIGSKWAIRRAMSPCVASST